MTGKLRLARGLKRRFSLDLLRLSLGLATLLLGLVAAKFDWFERIGKFVERHERWELDEALTVLMVTGIVALGVLTQRTYQLQREIIRRRDAEEAALVNFTLLRLAQKGAGAACWSLDLSGMVLSLCERGQEMLQLRKQSGIEVTTEWISMVDPRDRSPVFENLSKALADGSDFSFEYRVRLADGSERWISSFGSIMINPHDGSRGMRGLQFDITERRRGEERLRELEHRLTHLARLGGVNALATTLAHELNQPLAAISNYASGTRHLLEGAPNGFDDAAKAGLAGIEKNAMRAGEIIQRLRALIRITDIHRRPTAVKPLLLEAFELAMLRLPAADFTHELVIEADLIVNVDPLQIQQVILNLVSNGVDAMEGIEQRHLTLSAKRKNDLVQICVADTGCGISPEQAEMVFEQFGSTKANGLGVGLSICRTIVEAHGGTIWVESAENETKFSFTVPAWNEPEVD